MDRPREWEVLTAVLLYAGMAWAYLACPVRNVEDSRYSMLLSESLLHHGTFALDKNFTIPELEGKRGQPPAWTPYQLESSKGHWYHLYPPGGPILSIPVVAALNALGVATTDETKVHLVDREALVQSIVAAMVMAGFVVVVYFTALILLPRPHSVLVAIGTGFGTQVLSTASRGVWSHTWELFLLGVVILILLRCEALRTRLPAGWLATILSWMYFVRPSGAVVVVGVVAYVAVYHRVQLIRLLTVGALWLGAFVAYSYGLFGRLLPMYYSAAQAMNSDAFWESLAGTLFSPSRGLWVYVPVSAYVLVLVFHYRHFLVFRGLAVLALGCSALHVLAIASHMNWWAGHCYGARYTTDLVPWFALLAILGLAARREAKRDRGESQGRWVRVEGAVGMLLLLVSIFMNALGAVTLTGKYWNGTPRNIDSHPERLWDWSHAQFLAKFAWPLPWDFVPLTKGQRLEAVDASNDYCFWDGWSERRGNVRWTVRTRATFLFGWSGTPATRLTMQLRPHLSEGLRSQRVRVYLNGRRIGELLFRRARPVRVSLPISPWLLFEKNELQLQIRKARAPVLVASRARGDSLGVALSWLEFE